MSQASASSSKSSLSVDGNTWLSLAWLGVALQAVALVAVWWLQRWNGVWIIGGFLVVSGIFMTMQGRLPSLISFTVVVAAIVNAGGWAWNWYDLFVWFDETVHAFSSLAIIAALMYLLWTRGSIGSTPGGGAFILKAALFGLGLGIAWEIIEMMFLNLSVVDTLVDLVMDTVGAALGGWFAGWVIRQQGPRQLV